jgi:hypothetical protein
VKLRASTAPEPARATTAPWPALCATSEARASLHQPAARAPTPTHDPNRERPSPTPFVSEVARPFTHDINGVSIATVTPSPTFSLH